MTYIAATRRKSQSEVGGNCCSIEGSPDRTGRMNWLDTLRWGCGIVDGWRGAASGHERSMKA